MSLKHHRMDETNKRNKNLQCKSAIQTFRTGTKSLAKKHDKNLHPGNLKEKKNIGTFFFLKKEQLRLAPVIWSSDACDEPMLLVEFEFELAC